MATHSLSIDKFPLGRVFLVALSHPDAKLWHSSAVSKVLISFHWASGRWVDLDGGTIRYHPTKASAAAWQGCVEVHYILGPKSGRVAGTCCYVFGVSSGASRPSEMAKLRRSPAKTDDLLVLKKSQESSSGLDVLTSSDPSTDLRVGGSNPSGRANQIKGFSALPSHTDNG